jgi:hypothetical protein
MYNKYRLLYCLMIFAVAIIFSSCKKPETFPIEPSISEIQFNKYSNSSVSISFRFTDGDGDLGLNEADTVSTYACVPDSAGNCTNKFYFNIFLDQYKKINGQWEKLVDPPSEFGFYSRFKRISTTGKNKALDGNLEFDISSIYNIYFGLSPNDTIKYSFQIVDRQLHESNFLETNEIIFSP